MLLKKLTAETQYELLHKDRTATALFWTKNNKIKNTHWHKINDKQTISISDLVALKDVYLTPNEFHGWRNIRLLSELRALYVDIDRELSQYELNILIDDSGVPRPSFVVNSGRGWHLYWLIEPLAKRHLGRWQQVQDTLIERFNGDRAAKDCTRFLRLAETVNSKNNATVTGHIFDPVPWQFDMLYDEVIDTIDTKTSAVTTVEKAKVLDIQVAQAERKHKKKTSSQSSIYSWWYLVYQDLYTIASSYPEGIPEGYRNNFLHITAVAMSWFSSVHSIREALYDKAEKWTVGLTEKEVEDAISSAINRLEKFEKGEKVIYNGREVDPRYHYKRATIYALLKDIIKPQVANELRAIISSEQRTQRRAEREKKREPRDRVAEGRYKRHYEGLNSSKPWEAEGISRATWYRRRAKKD